MLVTRVLVDLFITQRFMLAWRTWLTDRLTGDWLDGRAYYRGQFIDDTIDNPDQRIQSDIDVFTAMSGPQPNTPHQTSNGTLPFGAISAIVSVVSFTGILWNLSGELSLFGFEMPRAMFWVGVRLRRVRDRHRVLARPPADPADLQQREVQRRVPLRVGAVARCRRIGRPLPRREAPSGFSCAPGSSRWCPTTSDSSNRTIVFTGWNLSMNHIIIPLPWVLQAPRLFAGQIKLGDVIQSVAAFGAIQDALSFFRNAYDVFAGYRASIIRLVRAGHRQRAEPRAAEGDGRRRQRRRRDRARRRRGAQPGGRAVDQRPEPDAAPRRTR